MAKYRLYRKTWWLVLLLGIVIGLVLFTHRYRILHVAIEHLDRVDVWWVGFTRQKIAALTFDDGPDPRYTPQILKILKKHQTPATFFMAGENAQKYPGLVSAICHYGHGIGNHTFSHPHLTSLTIPEITAELAATDRAVQTACGIRPALFRPPYEELSGDILSVSHRLHKHVILSTVTLEHAAAKSPRAMAKRAANMVFPGAIILVHDGRLNRTRTVQALPYLIEALNSKGYRIIPVQRLLATHHEKR